MTLNILSLFYTLFKYLQTLWNVYIYLNHYNSIPIYYKNVYFFI